MRDTIDIMVCTDCGFYIANGDTEGCNEKWKPELIEQRWDSYWLMSGDSEKDDEFSWCPCEACGSRLGGHRMHCVAMAN